MAVVTARMVQEDDSRRIFSKDIKVPTRMVGMIIGRRGERITRMQCETGCRIQIARDNNSLPERICTLTGNAWSIGKAEEQIEEFIRSRGHSNEVRSRPPATPRSSTNVQSSEITSSAFPRTVQNSVSALMEQSNPEIMSPDDPKIVQMNLEPPPSIYTGAQSYFEVTLANSADTSMNCESPSSVPTTVQTVVLTSIDSPNEQTESNTAFSGCTEEQSAHDSADSNTLTRYEAEEPKNEMIQSGSYPEEECFCPNVPNSQSTLSEVTSEQSCELTPKDPPTNAENVQSPQSNSADEQSCEITPSVTLTNVPSSVSSSIVPDADVKKESSPSTSASSCTPVQIDSKNSETELRESTKAHQTAHTMTSDDSTNVSTTSALTSDHSSNVNMASESSEKVPLKTQLHTESTSIDSKKAQVDSQSTSSDSTSEQTNSESTPSNSSRSSKAKKCSIQ